MQKALSELERENLVHSARTSGRFITEDKAMIEKMREELASTQIKEFLNKMSQMGFDYEKTITLLEKLGKENQKGVQFWNVKIYPKNMAANRHSTILLFP